MAKKLVPLFARVVVKADSLEVGVHAKFKGLAKAGFQLPDTAKDKDVPDEGEVVAIGGTATGVEVGDRVLWGKWAAKKIPGFEDLWVMADEDIIGKIVEE